MAPVARNLTVSVDGFLRDMKFLVIDNDTMFTKQFCRILADAQVGVALTAVPLAAYATRLHRDQDSLPVAEMAQPADDSSAAA
tara:strand:+ start:524 stop:772 length:249 start_codon:yes stop_codon:yes gene_type:complete